MLVSFKPRQGILKNLSMFRLNFDKFESISNLKKVNVFQDKTNTNREYNEYETINVYTFFNLLKSNYWTK